MSQPPEPGPVAELPGWTSMAHFALYFILGALLFLACGTLRNWRHSNIYLFAVIIGILYGMTDEMHQSFVPGRMMDALDWLVDCLGVSTGTLIMMIFRPGRNEKTAH
jgi:VanZ family protein